MPPESGEVVFELYYLSVKINITHYKKKKESENLCSDIYCVGHRKVCILKIFQTTVNLTPIKLLWSIKNINGNDVRYMSS